MELKNLIREDGGRAVVEAGSEAEASLRAMGFVEEAKESEPAAEPQEHKRGPGRPRKA